MVAIDREAVDWHDIGRLSWFSAASVLSEEDRDFLQTDAYPYESTPMKEPFRSRFQELVREGASNQDIHDVTEAVGYATSQGMAGDRYIERELRRVEAHQHSLLPLLEHFVGQAPSILDVGCNTGGTTVALALSPILHADEVVGVDPNRTALEAARVRSQGYDIPLSRIQFEGISPDVPLPFPTGRFDLTTCVSVLEFVSESSSRKFLTAELQRVTKPGGYVFLATPSPWRIREFHSRRLLGHFRHRLGYPWSSTPSAIRDMFRQCEQIPLSAFVVSDLLHRRHVPGARWFSPLSPVLAACLPWQKYLFRKRLLISTKEGDC